MYKANLDIVPHLVERVTDRLRFNVYIPVCRSNAHIGHFRFESINKKIIESMSNQIDQSNIHSSSFTSKTIIILVLLVLVGTVILTDYHYGSGIIFNIIDARCMKDCDCGHNATCINRRCSCKHGYISNDNRLSCQLFQCNRDLDCRIQFNWNTYCTRKRYCTCLNSFFIQFDSQLQSCISERCRMDIQCGFNGRCHNGRCMDRIAFKELHILQTTFGIMMQHYDNDEARHRHLKDAQVLLTQESQTEYFRFMFGFIMTTLAMIAICVILAQFYPRLVKYCTRNTTQEINSEQAILTNSIGSNVVDYQTSSSSPIDQFNQTEPNGTTSLPTYEEAIRIDSEIDPISQN